MQRNFQITELSVNICQAVRINNTAFLREGNACGNAPTILWSLVKNSNVVSRQIF